MQQLRIITATDISPRQVYGLRSQASAFFLGGGDCFYKTGAIQFSDSSANSSDGV